MRETVDLPSRAPRLPPIAPIDVLVVDDDQDFLELLILEIRRIPNVIVTVAHSPEQALNELNHRGFALIVSDWALNDSTAPEVLRTADGILHREPDPVPMGTKTPVLFMSGSEKVNETRVLHSLKHFEPVSFILKRCGASLIGQVASHILDRFTPSPNVHPC